MLPVYLASLLSLVGCSGSLNLSPSDHEAVLSEQLLEAPHPARSGPYRVLRSFYGSGTDRHRPEYRDSVQIVTEPVDASKLVDLGDSEDERNGYWGFTPEEFPINGRVWYPEGEGPFPLVLIVHGNHNMKDFSDPGYGYLGELLASRGFVFASVDMNFINGGIRGENDGRGWLLLKHLDAWNEFNTTENGPFFGKVDLDRVALIGHSRGGEAVGHAAAFNRLARYPDDASLEFDFNHGIRSIIAIAPVDGQYLPTGRPVPVKNVDYMVFHGSHDGDVTSFHGLRQYARVTYDDDRDHFKTAIYMYRANHGQWNTVWGNKDRGPRSGRSLELSALVDPEAQREFGKIYISAFLEATLMENDQYLPIFRDHRVIGQWLPETMYVTRFEASTFRSLATFEEDIDVTSGSEAGVTLLGDSLGTWSETLLSLRSRNRPTTSNSQQTNAVRLGWNNKTAGKPELDATPASYTVSLPPSLAVEWGLGAGTTLDFLLGALDQRPGPRTSEDEDEEDGEVNAGESDSTESDTTSDDEDEAPVDVTIEVADEKGQSSQVLLSQYGAIRKPLEIKVQRRNDAESFENQWEMVLQSYSIPLADFVEVNEALDITALRHIRLLFDQTEAGTVVLDDIGFSRLPPGFFTERP